MVFYGVSLAELLQGDSVYVLDIPPLPLDLGSRVDIKAKLRNMDTRKDIETTKATTKYRKRPGVIKHPPPPLGQGSRDAVEIGASVRRARIAPRRFYPLRYLKIEVILYLVWYGTFSTSPLPPRSREPGGFARFDGA